MKVWLLEIDWGIQYGHPDPDVLGIFSERSIALKNLDEHRSEHGAPKNAYTVSEFTLDRFGG